MTVASLGKMYGVWGLRDSTWLVSYARRRKELEHDLQLLRRSTKINMDQIKFDLPNFRTLCLI